MHGGSCENKQFRLNKPLAKPCEWFWFNHSQSEFCFTQSTVTKPMKLSKKPTKYICCAVLRCFVLCCVLLCCAVRVLCCVVLFWCFISYCTVLYFAILCRCSNHTIRSFICLPRHHSHLTREVSPQTT